MRRVIVPLVVVCLVVSAVAGVTVADQQVIGRPDVSVFAPDNVLVPGTERTLSVFVANDGRLDSGGPAQFESRVTTARAVRVEALPSDAPVTVRTGTVPVGVVPEGTTGPYDIRVAVAADAEPGTYELPVRLSYTYTRIVTFDETDAQAGPTYADASVTRRTTLTVRIEDRPSFSVVGVDSDVAVGGRGTVTLTVENVGTRTARDATVDVVSADPGLRVAEGETATLAAGRWRAGETKRLAVDARVADTATVRDYPLRLTVGYDDDDGIRRTGRPLTATVRPGTRDAFGVGAVESDLRVGQRGEVRGELTNRRERPLEDATLRLLDAGSLAPAESTYPLGTVPANGSVPFAFTVDVPRNASAGPRGLQFQVEYEVANERRRSDPIPAAVSVTPYRDVFAVEAREARVTVGGDSRLVVAVTNVGTDPVSEGVARLSVTEPLESDVPEAFVGSLAPGESTNVTFALSATDDAIPATLPATIQVNYTDTAGRDVVSEPATVGVTVVAEESSVPLPILAAVVVAVVGAGVWWWWRR